MKEEEVLGSFNNLVNKGLVTMETSKDLDGRMDEVVSLDGLYQIMAESLQGEEKKVEIDNVFNVFEQEFGRPLTPTEAELINGWLDTGISEELIKGALSEATYNGVRSFRYIDKIIYEWKKKGFKTMDDVNKNLRGEDKKKDSNNEELFDYDWLHDDE
jgi:DNA replication protein